MMRTEIICKSHKFFGEERCPAWQLDLMGLFPVASRLLYKWFRVSGFVLTERAASVRQRLS